MKRITIIHTYILSDSPKIQTFILADSDPKIQTYIGDPSMYYWVDNEF